MLPFHSGGTFLRSASASSRADVMKQLLAGSNKNVFSFGVFGIPWDGAVTNRPGSRFGPSSIRKASYMLCDATHPEFNVSPTAADDNNPLLLRDYGDIPLPITNIVEMRRALERYLGDFYCDLDVLKKIHPVFLGGDHSITLSTLRALRRLHDRPLACIHFDAHHDHWPDHFGEPEGHGTWVRQGVDEGVIDPECTFQVGIRSSSEEAPRVWLKERGGRVFTARDLRGVETVAALQEKVVNEITMRLLSNYSCQTAPSSPPIYLTFDIDCLDPAFAPGTGTPEPGGLTTNQALTIVEELSRHPQLNFVGMDLVEVAPAYDGPSEITSLAAAHIAWTYMCGRLATMEKKQNKKI